MNASQNGPALEMNQQDSIHRKVYGENPAIVMAATSGTKDERESARNQLKRLCLEEFKSTSKPGAEFFGQFYKLTKLINSAFARASDG